MSARIVCDRLILQDSHFPLNPLLIIDALTSANWCSEATFLTAITVRYTPNVSSDTPGQTILAAARTPTGEPAAAYASACKAIGPVWKGLNLVIPKSLLNFQRWTREDSPHLWLSSIGVAGTVDITCTLRCATHLHVPKTVLPSLTDRVSRLETSCYLGPVLAGFSYVGLMKERSQDGHLWAGIGQVINVDLKSGSGITTGHRYIRTPASRNYVAVRYGFGSSFTYVYTSSNQQYSWKSWRDTLVSYTTKDQLSQAVPVTYFGSWRPIRGSTSWWAEINPKYTGIYENVNGNMVLRNYYQSSTQLILYYEYPGVNIFSSEFKPSIQVTPGNDVPCPPGGAQPNKTYNLPLNVSRLQVAWNPQWNPNLRLDQLVSLFETAREEFIAWPVNCGAVPARRPDDTDECEEDLQSAADSLGEPGEDCVDR